MHMDIACITTQHHFFKENAFRQQKKTKRLIMIDAKESAFDNCSFKEALVLHSDFSASSFRFADLSEAIVNNVIFSQCDLRGANMSCAGLETGSLEGAIYDETTIWDESFSLTGCGAIKEEDCLG